MGSYKLLWRILGHWCHNILGLLSDNILWCGHHLHLFVLLLGQLQWCIKESLKQGFDMSLAIPEPHDVSQCHRILGAGTFLRPHRHYDLRGALAWAQSREGRTSGAQSFGALPDVA